MQTNLNTVNNYEVPFNHQIQPNTTTLKTNQLVRTSQPAHFEFNGLSSLHSSVANSPHKISKLSKNLAKKNQLDKLRFSLTGVVTSGQQLPTSTRALASNELAEVQNLNNSIIEDQLFKANDSVCRLLINNGQKSGVNEGGQITSQFHSQLTSDQLSGGPNDQFNNQMASQAKYRISSQSVENLTDNKPIGNRLLDFYNNNLQSQAFANQTYSIGKPEKGRFNSNLSLRTKYQRCVVNIPNLPTVFKSAFANQSDLVNKNFNDNESLASESLASEDISSPPPPPAPERKVSLPVASPNESHDEGLYSKANSTNQFFFNDSTDLKNQTKCLSFNHSTPTLNNLNQFRYNLYMNKLKENIEYHKQQRQDSMRQSNESIINAISNSSSQRSIGVNQHEKMDEINVSKIDDSNDNNQDEVRPSTSNTTRIMVNYKK